jgi:cyclin H
MVTEDEIYRSSSQYKFWNFPASRLSALRTKTNKIAAQHAAKAIARHSSTADIEFLTVDEERDLVCFYCSQLIFMTHSPALPPDAFPSHVVATAVQFIKRFYLTNSPMSYAPKSIMVTALYLACKTESHHLSVRRFVSLLNPIKGLESLTADEVLAPEYILTQGLRFTFDVRHPFRALKGAFVELQLLLNYARGDTLPEAWRIEKPKSGKAPKVDGQVDVQRYLLDKYQSPVLFAARIEKAYGKARDLLHKEALVTDVYFLYTPSQIMFSALYFADAALVRDLLALRLRLPLPSSTPTPAGILARRPTLDAIMTEIEGCARELGDHAVGDSEKAKQIAKKLEICRNPDKVDLVGLNRAVKRDAAEDGVLDENVAKKRKLEREGAEKEGENLFGPALVKPQ